MSKINVKEILENQDYNCVSIRGDEIYTSNLSGVMPILAKLIENSSFFTGAVVGDIVIGKAAAMLLIYGNVESIYAKVISEQAIPFLEKYQIPFTYDTLVPNILNRNKDGMCPMEQLVLNINDPTEAYLAIFHKIKGN